MYTRERRYDSEVTRTTISHVLLGIILGCLLILLLLCGLALANSYTTQNIVQDQLCCNCYQRGRSEAIDVAKGIAYALNLLTIDPNYSTELFISFFATNSTLSTPLGNIIGITDINNYQLTYALNPGETNQTIVNHKYYWDPKTSALSIERNWTATTLIPRYFLNYTSLEPILVSPNFTYTRDESLIIRFDCHFKIVYYRVYSDSLQSVSTFTSDYHACLPCYHYVS